MVTVFKPRKSTTSCSGRILFVCINIPDAFMDSLISLFTFFLALHCSAWRNEHTPQIYKLVSGLTAARLLRLCWKPSSCSHCSASRRAVAASALFRCSLVYWHTNMCSSPFMAYGLKTRTHTRTHRHKVCGTVGLLGHVCAMWGRHAVAVVLAQSHSEEIMVSMQLACSRRGNSCSRIRYYLAATLLASDRSASSFLQIQTRLLRFNCWQIYFFQRKPFQPCERRSWFWGEGAASLSLNSERR